MKRDIQEEFAEKLARVVGDGFSLRWETDSKGVVTGWCRLRDHRHITNVALIVASLGGRVITITAYKTKDAQQRDGHEIAYHFDLDGCTCTVTIEIPRDSGKVNSITPILKSADWTERELQELYGIEVVGHPNPRRLFLDETIDEGIMDKLIPLSVAMNGATSKTLWEKVLAAISQEGDIK
ncbi:MULTISPECIES: NADH-quinone oxidoreductase subunit C [Carboxydocella]|uniref:NADH dehydrogenase subunit C n=2 Tax=Carboxydocella TaxID=178898 RepID=A0A1T4R5J5_9FIRM|nr:MULTISPECIES: NADH-quinone oxidoreductase subunit C [Carboxydocella]AVX19378.1 carbon monoxide-induced hydrogenase subunit CooU [Carboxydocella thermautotrophica]AVX29791.1 carbon monoxide-induced hydrogenase subunit CooU [Carboxydocella thermautotrophica]SKA11199.1 NADH dehydrogenase subunit C [Carboxydocella sporoproducens DSM 16521]GAW29137.1 NADH dehydrogenase [Carboxydocella sp. ULO1]GAW32014.1 NADH dehydrogenase [Carboxydocella sp. JDF658]